MRRTLGLWAAAALAVGFVAGQSLAQGPRGPGGGGGGGFASDPLSLLRNQNVRKELEVEADQEKQIEAIRQELEKELDAARKQLAAKYQEKLDKVLLPNQSERLEQISLQMRGLAALADPEVAKKLGLSEEQTKEIAAKRAEGDKQTRELFGAGGGGGGAGGDFRERMEKMQKIRQDTEAAVLAVLSEKQKEDYTKLKGKEIDRRSLFQGPGGGGGRPGAQPGGGQGRPKRPDTE